MTRSWQDFHHYFASVIVKLILVNVVRFLNFEVILKLTHFNWHIQGGPKMAPFLYTL